MTRVVADIDCHALVHNVGRVKAYAPRSKILAMVKANAYGHGLSPIAKHLSSAVDKHTAAPLVDGLGVAQLSEAIALRDQGVTGKIVLMGGFNSAEELSAIARHQLDVVIHAPWQVAMLDTVSLSASPIAVWMKIETGMHRLGFQTGQIDAAYQALSGSNNIQHPMTLMTHFSNAYSRSHAKTEAQWDAFQSLPMIAHHPTSAANSAAVMAWPTTQADWVRPGIMLYGVSPFEAETGGGFDLKPVMQLSSRIIAIHDLQPGDCVGYGGAWCADQPTRIGVVDIGYGDGYPRHINEGSPVLLDGTRCNIVGRVSMDRLTIDLTPCPHASIHDRVVLWGAGLPVEEIAMHANTIAYELLSQLTSRVVYRYHD